MAAASAASGPPLWEAVALMGASRFEDALAILDPLAASASASTAPHDERRTLAEQRGVCLVAEGKFEDGLALLRDAAAPPSIVGPATFLAGDTTEALETYLAQLPTCTVAEAPLLWLRTAHAHSVEGRDVEAEECLRKALSLKCPREVRAQVHHDLAAILAQRSGKDKDALHHMKRALEYSQDQTDASVVHAGLQAFDLGSLLLAQGEFERAVHALSMAKSLLPPEAAVHHALGAAHIGAGSCSKAVPELQEALVLCPSSIASRKLLAAAHLKLGSHNAAIEQLVLGLQDHPNSVYLLKQLADAYILTNETTEAEATLEKLLRLDPSDEVIRHRVRALRFVPRAAHALVISESAQLPRKLRDLFSEAGHMQANIHNVFGPKANPENIVSYLKELSRALQENRTGNFVVYIHGSLKRAGQSLVLNFGSGDVPCSSLFQALNAAAASSKTVMLFDVHAPETIFRELSGSFVQEMEASFHKAHALIFVAPSETLAAQPRDHLPALATQLSVCLGASELCVASPGCTLCGEYMNSVFEAGVILAADLVSCAASHLKRDSSSGVCTSLTLPGASPSATVGLPLRF